MAGVFHHHCAVNPLGGVSDFLYGKRVYAGSCANPEMTDSVFKGYLKMVGGRDFDAYWETEISGDALQPGEGLLAGATEGVGSASGFPDATAEEGDRVGQAGG